MTRFTALGCRLLTLALLGLSGLVLQAQPVDAQRTRRRLPPLSHFDIISEKNLFHPDRIPQTPPPTTEESDIDLVEPPTTTFVLQGVILFDDGRSIALLQEPKLTEKKVRSFNEGEKIGPYVLKTVKNDRVILALGGNEFEVVLHKPAVKPKPPKPPRPPTRAPQPSRRRRPRP